MAILYPLLIVVHILICLGLIIVVLLQSSKGEGLAGAFGGGGGLTGAVFGGRGAATFLSKATTVFAILFMVTSITLTFMSLGVKGGAGPSGVIQNLKTGPVQAIPPPETSVPGAPATSDTGAANIFNQAPKTDTAHK
jgi:preprotein translocase subunit SecG